MKSPSVLLPGINHMNGLNHNALTCSAVPIPPWERSLQTVEAQPYFNVSQASLVLEGIVFDRNNNLLFVDVATGRVFKLTPERQLSIVLKENSFGASGLAVHKDGRIFIASVGDMQRGSVRAIEPDGTREQMIVAPDTGFLVNDLVFDNQGGFYFTDSRGNSADPQITARQLQHELLAPRAFRQCWQQHQSRAYPEGLRSHTFLTQRHRFAFVGT